MTKKKSHIWLVPSPTESSKKSVENETRFGVLPPWGGAMPPQPFVAKKKTSKKKK